MPISRRWPSITRPMRFTAARVAPATISNDTTVQNRLSPSMSS